MTRSIFISCLTCAILNLFCSAAFGARYVKVEVSVDGEVILEGNASDDGHRDADEIWEALKHAKLRETDAFKKLKIPTDLMEYKFERGRPKSPPFKIDASYGGEHSTYFLKIKRVVASDGPAGTWRIDPEVLDTGFDFRSISRGEARRLKNPKFDKNEELIKAKDSQKIKKN